MHNDELRTGLQGSVRLILRNYTSTATFRLPSKWSMLSRYYHGYGRNQTTYNLAELPSQHYNFRDNLDISSRMIRDSIRGVCVII